MTLPATSNVNTTARGNHLHITKHILMIVQYRVLTKPGLCRDKIIKPPAKLPASMSLHSHLAVSINLMVWIKCGVMIWKFGKRVSPLRLSRRARKSPTSQSDFPVNQSAWR